VYVGLLQIITSGGVTYKNEPWHRECFTCTHCNTSLAGQRFTSRDEKPYCADCFGELFAKRCTACSKPITGLLCCIINLLHFCVAHIICCNCCNLVWKFQGMWMVAWFELDVCPVYMKTCHCSSNCSR
jgi:hypothetical protein